MPEPSRVDAVPIGLNASPAVGVATVSTDVIPSSPRVFKVLVVEDEEQVRTVTQRVLAHAGFEVTTANNGVEAYDRIRRNSGGFDVVVSDVLMPELDGIGLAMRCHAEYPSLRFVFMTGLISMGQDRSRIRTLSQAVINKPFDIGELVETVRGVAAGV